MKDRNYLIEKYNATSVGDEHGEIETYETWLERQLLPRIERVDDLKERLQQGREYLMQVEPDDITVEDSLEAFGFGRNGLIGI